PAPALATVTGCPLDSCLLGGSGLVFPAPVSGLRGPRPRAVHQLLVIVFLMYSQASKSSLGSLPPPTRRPLEARPSSGRRCPALPHPSHCDSDLIAIQNVGHHADLSVPDFLGKPCADHSVVDVIDVETQLGLGQRTCIR